MTHFRFLHSRLECQNTDAEICNELGLGSEMSDTRRRSLIDERADRLSKVLPGSRLGLFSPQQQGELEL